MEDNGRFIRGLFFRHTALNIIAQLISVIVPLIGSVTAGQVFGSGGLTIVSVCSPLFFLASFAGIVISGGSSAMAAKLIAREDREGVNHVYTTSVILTVAVSGAICTLMLFFYEEITAFLGGGELGGELKGFYIYSAFYVFFTILVHIPLYWARLSGKPEISIILTVTLGSATCFFNYYFIYCFKMEIEGIALSQAAATALTFVLTMFFLHRGSGLRFAFPKSIFKNIAGICVTGSPMGLSRLYRFVIGIVSNTVLLNLYGAPAVAVYGVLNTLLRFFTAFSSGVTATLMPMAGVFKEERDTKSIRQIMSIAYAWGNAAILPICILLLVFNLQISEFFGLAEPQVFNLATIFFCVYVFFLFNCYTLIAYYTAAGKISFANIIAFMFDLLFPLTSVLILGGILDAGYIWAHMPLAGIATVIVFIPILIIRKLVNKSLSFLLLNDLVHEKSGKYISFSVNSDLAEACKASEKITEFCEANCLPPKTVMLISMSIEEMITLIINNKTKGKNFTIAVRIFLLDDKIILRIRDAGEQFNPVEYYMKNMDKDMEKCIDIIGIKYIAEKAERIHYSETFGVNNLVVII